MTVTLTVTVQVYCIVKSMMTPDETFQEFLSGTEHAHCLLDSKKFVRG